MVTVALAILIDPAGVGVYSSVVVVLSLYQVAFDWPLRHVAYRAINAGAEGLAFIKNLRQWGSWLGSGLVTGYILILAALGKIGFATAALMLPAALVPLCSAFGLSAMVTLQLSGRWRLLAIIRVSSVVASLCLTIPLLAITKSLLVASLQLVVAEGLTSVLVRSVVSAGGRSEKEGAVSGSAKRLWQAAGYQLLGWLRAQADRITLIVVGDVAQVGLYSLALATARMPVEAALGSALNVLRSELAREDDEPRAGAVRVSRFIARLELAAVGVVLIGSVVVVGFGTLVLGPEWGSGLAAVPILLMSVFPSINSWALGAAAAHYGTAARGYSPQALGIVLGVPVGIIASHSLLAGAMLFTLREVIVSALESWFYRDLATRMTLLYWLTPCVVGLLVVGVSWL